MTPTPDPSKTSVLSSFEKERIHILGIGGTLMGSFAAFLKSQNITVTGTDQNIYPPMSLVLEKAQIPFFSGYKPENLDAANPTLVIVGNVIRSSNPEMLEVVRRGLRYLSLPAAMEELILPHKHPLVVAGTHGKTTTTTMLSFVLHELGQHPSYFIGGVPQDLPQSFFIDTGPHMVLEGDEYDTAYFDKVPKFTHYRPQDAILTSLEYDHADIYPDLEAVEAAFSRLITMIPSDGSLIVCQEAKSALRLTKSCKGTVIPYGFSELSSRDAGSGQNLELSPEGCRFLWQGKSVFVPVSGRHNALNALAVLTLVHRLKLDTQRAIEALSRFRGVKRRQEIYAEVHQITLIDDFAHHPTAVKETLDGLRKRYPQRRLIACFEPRSATSRRKVFQKAYSESFDAADFVYIAKPFDQSGLDTSNLFSTDDLISDLQNRGRTAGLLGTTQPEVHTLSQQLKAQDVVVVMSNGGFDGLLPKLREAIASQQE